MNTAITKSFFLRNQIRFFAKPNRLSSKSAYASRPSDEQLKEEQDRARYQEMLDQMGPGSTGLHHDPDHGPQQSYFSSLYRPYLESLYKDDELKSNDMDLQGAMSQLQQKQIDYDKVHQFLQFQQKKKDGSLTKADEGVLQEMDAADRVVREKMSKAAETKVYIDFFSPTTIEKMMEETPSEVLTELGIRAYTGSRDVPKDDTKALGLMARALTKAQHDGSEYEIDMAEYYQALIGRDMLQDAKKKATAQEDVHLEQKLQEDLLELGRLDIIIEEKAQKGIGEALFTFGKDLYRYIRQHETDKREDFLHAVGAKDLSGALQLLEAAAAKGVVSSYFFLGIMAIEGVLVERDVEAGLEFLVKGAAKNNAYCYYYLAMLHSEGTFVEKNERLEYIYVERAAKQGFAQMQHNLAQIYFEGRLTKKDDKLALAWFREACRNGFYTSYLNAGDILYHGSIPGLLPPESSVKQNRLFALSMYLSAYQHGALFLEVQIRKCLSELVEFEGFKPESLPQVNFVNIPAEDREFIKEQYQKDQEQRRKMESEMKRRIKQRS